MNTITSLLAFGPLLASLTTPAATPLGPGLGQVGESIGPASDAPPAPVNVQVIEDNRLARLSWNNWPAWSTDPSGVYGYQIRWGQAGGELNKQELQGEAIVNLEPLEPGVLYEAEIRSIDKFGRLSAPSPRVQFASESTRVDALKDRMTGFFDNFELPYGMPDERKWNTTWSLANDPAKNSVFINGEGHLHTTVSSLFNDRSQVVSRPREIFDFRNRTGEIAFDFDMVARRNIWYLDVMPQLLDITSHAHLGIGRGFPAHMLRYRQDGSKVEIRLVDEQGNEQLLADSGWSLTAHGVKLAPHVRQNWQIKLSRDWTGVYINGNLVCEADLDLGWERGWVHFTLFSYNTSKANMPMAMADWGNFGFDGPPTLAWTPPILDLRLAPTGASYAPKYSSLLHQFFRRVTHNYLTSPADGSVPVIASDFQPKQRVIHIPDSIRGATKARLMFTLQMRENRRYEWDPQDAVLLNGQAFAIPEPTGAGMSGSQLVNAIMPYSVVIPVPPSLVLTGDNTVEFRTKSSEIANVHLELDFPKVWAPSYTQPNDVYDLPVRYIPPTDGPGPSVTITELNGEGTWSWMSGTYNEESATVKNVSGEIEIEVSANEDISVMSTGKHVGLVELQVWMNDDLIQTVNTALESPTPGGTYTFVIDTRDFPNGLNKLFVQGVDANGSLSIPDYFQANARPGDYFPLHLNIDN
ncbi:MAG: fibronectin type III domain-containing protein [Fimbriimonadaceae bacterium]